MTDKKIYSLSQLARSIQNVVEKYCYHTVWLKAEIVKLNYYSKTGHCYPALVEKKNGSVIAELRGNIWSSNFQRINHKFKEVLKEELKDNMSVVIQGQVTFHPVHGLALNIVDIDPEYTLGELAREKAETIRKLQEDRLFYANKETELPSLLKTIAIISVETSKGYQDFLNIINGNPNGFRFHFLLFPAILQGERAVNTITEQLNRIREYPKLFDAVAIIRGGGGEIGLSSFDNYHLAKEIASFPIPVLTGIGHASNETVSEMVSYESFITPTKIAEFILQKFQNFYSEVEQKEERLLLGTQRMFRDQKEGLKHTSRLFGLLTSRVFERNHNHLQQGAYALNTRTTSILKNEQQQLNLLLNKLVGKAEKNMREEGYHLTAARQSLMVSQKSFLCKASDSLHFIEEKIRMLSPENILKRGYSITRQRGKVITDTSLLKEGEPVETQLAVGGFSSKVEQTDKIEHYEPRA